MNVDAKVSVPWPYVHLPGGCHQFSPRGRLTTMRLSTAKLPYHRIYETSSPTTLTHSCGTACST
jgi:hypothetical protein